MRGQSVFICYSHMNKWQVQSLVDTLRMGGYEPWFDFALVPGQDWQSQLFSIISQCDAFVYAMTPESLTSEWCWWEITQAAQLKKPIIPICIQPKLNLPPELRRLQSVDFSEGPTSQAVAKLMYGLRFATTLPINEIPLVPQIPKGNPPQALGGNFSSPLTGKINIFESDTSVLTVETINPYNKANMTIDLQRFFDFTAEELILNKNNKLSERQIKKYFNDMDWYSALFLAIVTIVVTLLSIGIFRTEYKLFYALFVIIDLYMIIMFLATLPVLLNRKTVKCVTGVVSFPNPWEIMVDGISIAIYPSRTPIMLPGIFHCYFLKKFMEKPVLLSIAPNRV